MAHQASAADLDFRKAFENCRVRPEDFDHKAHVRLAYVFLCGSHSADASRHMKQALLTFLDHLGVGSSKFHETLTSAWIDAVSHFMARCETCSSFEEFIEINPVLLDSKIMLSHYSVARLFSDDARARYIDPDMQPIPRH